MSDLNYYPFFSLDWEWSNGLDSGEPFMSSSKGRPEVEMARVHIKGLEKIVLILTLLMAVYLPLCLQWCMFP